MYVDSKTIRLSFVCLGMYSVLSNKFVFQWENFIRWTKHNISLNELKREKAG